MVLNTMHRDGKLLVTRDGIDVLCTDGKVDSAALQTLLTSDKKVESIFAYNNGHSMVLDDNLLSAKEQLKENLLAFIAYFNEILAKPLPADLSGQFPQPQANVFFQDLLPILRAPNQMHMQLKYRMTPVSVVFHDLQRTKPCSKLPAEAGGFNPPKR